MKVSFESLDHLKHPEVLMDRQEAVGNGNGNGKTSFLFDSGCNLSGLRKIHIYYWTLPLKKDDIIRQTTIKRIMFEFEKQFNLCPSYLEDTNSCCIPTILEIEKKDLIVRIDVWTVNKYSGGVQGIRFHFNSGCISELYGAPHAHAKMHIFEGKHPASRLVGVHGFYNDNIRKLGFTFATVKEPPVGAGHPRVPPLDIDTESNASVIPEEEKSTWGIPATEEIVVLATLESPPLVIDTESNALARAEEGKESTPMSAARKPTTFANIDTESNLLASEEEEEISTSWSAVTEDLGEDLGDY